MLPEEEVVIVKVGDSYQLSYGHEGRVVYVNENETVFCVQGRRRGCATCGKGRSSQWTPITYLMREE